jgi:hypothetical protein
LAYGSNGDLEVSFSPLGFHLYIFTFHSQVKFLRKQHGSLLNMFAPVNDLSALSKSSSTTRSLLPGKKNDVAIAGGQILGDEYSDHVVKVRN